MDTHDSDQRIHRDIIDGFGQVQAHNARVFEAKNRQYGWRNIAEIGFRGVISRMTDKFARLKSGFIGGESKDDALIDISNYANIARMLLAGRWPGQQNEDEPFVLRVKRILDTGGIKMPAKPGDVGYDLVCAEARTIDPNSETPTYIRTGIAIKAPDGVWTRIAPRSSTTKRGLHIPCNTIDNEFTGELLIPCFNMTSLAIHVNVGDRLAQLICCPMIVPNILSVSELPQTDRGGAGFGSTGQRDMTIQEHE